MPTCPVTTMPAMHLRRSTGLGPIRRSLSARRPPVSAPRNARPGRGASKQGAGAQSVASAGAPTSGRGGIWPSGDVQARFANWKPNARSTHSMARLYDRLGDAYLRSDQYPEAQQALNRAVLLEPRHGPLYPAGTDLSQVEAAHPGAALSRPGREDGPVELHHA